ncbi:hypothetical protein K469DRAFT_569734 [Zopfia rhizophila CBS 207.26]|uniref:CENP-V/GFA domain-containing protein n=1 Tax=Zopfia rhizophila CBS 207.26 TaxID=1314779 RepID=A0A6A6EBQ4_9PEZI|nr:hypothetical protein K469DRAFT_569734 [Zopfia rhizophila CBS 207.26]
MAKAGCLCGKITYEFTGEPLLCHCLKCRRITGTAYSTNVTIPSSSVTISGTPKQFIFASGQGPVFKISFCGDCSSTMWKESDAEGFEGYHSIQSGTLGEEFDHYKPDGEIFTPQRTKWLAPIENTRQFDGTDVGL